MGKIKGEELAGGRAMIEWNLKMENEKIAAKNFSPIQKLDPFIENRFQAGIPAGVDRQHIALFVEAWAGIYKMSREDVMESALATPEEFYEVFRTWEAKNFPIGPERVLCPGSDRLAEFKECEICSSRERCPAF